MCWDYTAPINPVIAQIKVMYMHDKNVFLSALACSLILFWKLVARGCFAGSVLVCGVVLLQCVSAAKDRIIEQFG